MGKNMRRAIYAGSFDPVTKGHLWMIEQGADIFDELIVSVGTNPEKRYTWNSDERVEMLEAAAGEMPRVRIEKFDNLFLVDFAKQVGADHILRGIRSQSDYEFERAMRHINGDLGPGIETVFLMPPRKYAEVSSSMIKGLIGPEGWRSTIQKYVPRAVYQQILKKYHLEDNGAEGSNLIDLE